MNSKKFFSVMLASIVVLMVELLSTPSIPAYAATTSSTLTVDVKYINQYTPAKLIYGYAKNANGSALVNQTLYVARYDTLYTLNRISEIN